MQKYFISKDNFNQNRIIGEDAFHIKTVMRNRVGDSILVSNQEQTYFVKITEFLDNEVHFEIIEQSIGNHELPVFVSIIQGYPKSDKMEEIIKHGTELGAYTFIPTVMKRSVVKIEEKKKASRLIRLNKIAKEAAEQSNRDIIPTVVDIMNLKQIDFSVYDKIIVCYEEASKQGELIAFKTAIKKLQPQEKIAIVVGPEGGLDDSEIEYLKSKGCCIASLGNRILRTETVVFYCLSAIGYELELKHE